MTLPEIASEIAEIGRTLGYRRLIKLAAMMKRRRNQRAAPQDRHKMTPAKRRKIRAYVSKHPDKTQLAVANRFKVGQGRVSEALHGKRR